ncbi:unnamed protein product [Owenia fusiformis]|uniref:Uncharacterized protein n=1 Tax=Owenia fusiformis TaxID=6347 RepID=A0A8J1U582_OWEFU|nr:unnamed protein product [Owenia fusiformis]
MIITKFFCIIFGTLQFNVYEANDIITHEFEIQKFKRYEASAELMTLYGIRSMKICFAKCAKEANCVRVNYQKSAKICELIDLSEGTSTCSVDTEWNHGYLRCKNHNNKDCQTLRENDCWKNGVYLIQPDPNQPAFNVYCDMQDGGWTVIQRRYDGSAPFYNKTWNEYKNGFGDPNNEHWLGNNNIHVLTTSASYEIKFDLMTPNNTWYDATYSHFSIQDESGDYELSIGSYIGGTAGDSIWPNGAMTTNTRLNGMKFSTTDVDNDLTSISCVNHFNGGGWWYESCAYARLNGKYSPDGIYHQNQDGVTWYQLTHIQVGDKPSLMATTMKLRRSP